MLKIINIFVFCILSFSLIAQNDTVYKKYYYPNGNLSSEGYLVNGKPDAYWKTYHENGKLKSEGNRKNYALEGEWFFYDNQGDTVLIMEYKNNKKHGLRTAFFVDEIVQENYSNDVKQGIAKVFHYPSRKLKKKMNYENGKIEGKVFEYNKEGRIISIFEYKKGYLVSRERINRYNTQNKKTGLWKEFDEEGNLKTETMYMNGKKNGFHKTYDKTGKLISIEKYINDELQKDVAELKEYELRKDYYPSGKIKIIGSYYDGKADGIRREYSEEGKIIRSYIFDNGNLIGEGIVDERGLKQGQWTEYYSSGEKLAEGEYKDSKKIKEWKYYHKNGKLEQIGNYDNKGRANGNWKWYYDTGSILKEENYLHGKEEGSSIEYAENGKIIAKGEYLDGLKEGFWFTDIGDHREEGKYFDGERHEEWKHYYTQDSLIFVGSYINGVKEGKHIHYWANGNKKREESYIMGIKDGEWRYYDKNGVLFIRIKYKDGIEIQYDNYQLEKENLIIQP
jgi:antitoxin component YwqK of YwqJK toxin-antitoxin module